MRLFELLQALPFLYTVRVIDTAGQTLDDKTVTEYLTVKVGYLYALVDRVQITGEHSLSLWLKNV